MTTVGSGEKSFTRRADAQRWLDNEITAKLATGTYVAPEAGRVTVGAVYKSWSTSQGHISAKTAATRRSALAQPRVSRSGSHVTVGDVKTSCDHSVGGRRWSPMRSALRLSGMRSGCCARSWEGHWRTTGLRTTRAMVCGYPSAGTPTADTSPMARSLRWPTQLSASPRWSGCWPTPVFGGARCRRCARVRLRHAAPPRQRVTLGHRIWWPRVVDTEDMGAPVCAVPGHDWPTNWPR